MLLAIDAGNSHTVFGVWDGQSWRAVWRRATNAEETEDQLGAWLRNMFAMSGLPFQVEGAICASVVPQLNQALQHLASKWLSVPLTMLERGADCGIEIDYQPSHAVGADRIANALGALDRFDPPLIVVDFGTATTFDAIDAEGVYVGGAILPGIVVSTQALVAKTAKLPQIEYKAPGHAIGKTTVESLQSGIMLGYAGAIDSLAEAIRSELGGAAIVLATGGLGGMFVRLAKSIQSYEPNLTLDGLRIAYGRLNAT